MDKPKKSAGSRYSNIVTHGVRANFSSTLALPLRPPRAKVVLPYRRKISSPESLALSFWERHRHRNASFEFPKKFTPAGKYPRRHGVIRSSGNIRQSGDCAASAPSPIRASPFHRHPLVPATPLIHATWYPRSFSGLSWPIRLPIWWLDLVSTPSRKERDLLCGKASFPFNSGALHRCLLLVSPRLAEDFNSTPRIQE